MITGFNTDVEYQGVTYHVQTEDKGVATPMIMSLVYDRGTILASKRSPYDDLLKEELDEKVLAERLQKQHHLICAAVKAGRIEDLKRMTMKDAEASKQKKLVVQREVVRQPDPQIVAPATPQPVPQVVQDPAPKSLPQHQPPPVREVKPVPAAVKAVPRPVVPVETPAPPVEMTPVLPPHPPSDMTRSLADQIDRAKAAPVAKATEPPRRITEAPAVPKPSRQLEWGYPIDITEDDLIIDGVEIVEEEMILPAEAVAIVSEYASAAHNVPAKLNIDFVNETSFKGGERKTLGILIFRGIKENAVTDAQIMVKVLGSSFRPLIFHAKTDDKGVATVHLQLPHFKSGRAALLVRAMSGGEEVEIRRRVSHG